MKSEWGYPGVPCPLGISGSSSGGGGGGCVTGHSELPEVSVTGTGGGSGVAERLEAGHPSHGPCAGGMGLQPHRPPAGLAPLVGVYYPLLGGVGLADDEDFMDPHGHGARCQCAYQYLPGHRTILHSILTGQGHKVGYGLNDGGGRGESGVGGPPPGLWQPDPRLQTQSHPVDYSGHPQPDQGIQGLCMLSLDALTDRKHKVHSPEVTSPSKYISPPLAK